MSGQFFMLPFACHTFIIRTPHVARCLKLNSFPFSGVFKDRRRQQRSRQGILLWGTFAGEINQRTLRESWLHIQQRKFLILKDVYTDVIHPRPG